MSILQKIFTLIVDGVRHAVTSDKIEVRDDKIYAGGRVVVSGLKGTVKVQFEGGLASLDCADAQVIGNITGSVDCSDLHIEGNIQADTVDCSDIHCKGNIEARKIDASDIHAFKVTKIKKHE